MNEREAIKLLKENNIRVEHKPTMDFPEAVNKALRIYSKDLKTLQEN